MRMNINDMPLTSEESRKKDIEDLEKLRPLDDTFMVRQEVAIQIA